MTEYHCTQCEFKTTSYQQAKEHYNSTKHTYKVIKRFDIDELSKIYKDECFAAIQVARNVISNINKETELTWWEEEEILSAIISAMITPSFYLSQK